MGARNGIVLLGGLVAGLALSFLGFGLMWIGLSLPAQLINSVLFFTITYLLGRAAPKNTAVYLAIGGGAFPLGALLTQFRDKNDSHFVPIVVVAGWAAGIIAGTWLAQRRKTDVD